MIPPDRSSSHREQLKSFLSYYRRFGTEFVAQIWQVWRREVASTLVIALIIFLLSYYDSNAKTALQATAEACGIYLFVWAAYHLVRTPWKLSLAPAVPDAKSAISFRSGLLNLSIEVLNFIYERQKAAPERPVQEFVFARDDGSKWLEDMLQFSNKSAAVKKFDSDTAGIYSYRFKRRVQQAAERLKEIGFPEEMLADLIRAPENWMAPYSETIKQIGTDIGELADQLDESAEGNIKQRPPQTEKPSE